MTTISVLRRRLLATVALAPLVMVPAAAQAVPLIWQNPGAGDWFDGGYWDGGGAVPGPADQASISNGGTAQATAGSVDVTSLFIAGDTTLGPVQSGFLEADGFDVNVSGATRVGSALSATSVSSLGDLTVTNAGLSLGGSLSVGNVGSSAAGASATGAVTVDQAISGAGGSLFIGWNAAAGGTADGAVSGRSYTGNHGFVGIGRDTDGGSGTGSLVVTDGLSLGGSVSFLEVGLAVIDGLTADGTLSAGSGNVQTSATTSIGAHIGATAGVGNAQGSVSLGGNLSNTGGAPLLLGYLGANRTGMANGSLTVDGLSGYGTQNVGVTESGSMGSATGTLTVGTGGIVGGSLEVGKSETDAVANGTVMVADGGDGLTGGLEVGEANGAGGTADGALTVAAGGLSLGGVLSVGNVASSAVGASATGTVTVDQAITGAGGSLFIGSNRAVGGTADGAVSGQSYAGNHLFIGIGRDDEGGSGTGSLVVTDGLSLGGSVSFLEVGLAVIDGLTADGTLIAGSGDVQTRATTSIGTHVGATTGIGNAQGTVSLGGSLSNTAGSLLQVGVLGANRTGTAAGSLTVDGLSGYGTQLVGVAQSGASGTATGMLMAGTGGISGGSLQVGVSSGGDTNGTVEVSGGDVDLGAGSLSIGVLSSNTGGNAVGKVQVAGGDLRMDGSLAIGNVSGAGATNMAQAMLDVSAGALSARGVAVGQAFGSGSANGTLKMTNVTGAVTSLQAGESFDAGGNPFGDVQLSGSTLGVERFVALGSGLGGGTGNARLAMRDSGLVVGTNPTGSGLDGNMYVAASGAGSMAEVSLTRSLIEVTDTLFMGAGALLDIHLDGAVRGSEYGAIDAERATLNGVLDIRFDFVPMLDSLMFDLIVSGLPDGIGGDFMNVNIFGLDSGYSATTGIVSDFVGTSEVEIYRLTIARIDDVAEPSALGLFGGAVIGLFIVYRRRKRC